MVQDNNFQFLLCIIFIWGVCEKYEVLENFRDVEFIDLGRDLEICILINVESF